MTRLLLRDVEIYGAGLADCRIADGVIVEVARSLQPTGETILEGRSGALLPGLADHHLHLAAIAAHQESLDLSAVGRGELAAVITQAAGPGEWIRAVGYDDSAHGELDRHTLDLWAGSTPLRIQHRSGALWVLNSAALERLAAARSGHQGIERDPRGIPTGRLWRADDWLAVALGDRPPLSLRSVGARLAAYGITHVTDASPGSTHLELVADAVERGDLPQHVQLMAENPTGSAHPRLRIGPVKVVVGDHELPDLDELVARIGQAHDSGRAVAVHCVTRTALALTLAASDAAGRLDGDRIEHCAVADRALIGEVAARGLRVVTQPSLVARRGDEYWAGCDPADRADLWPHAGLLAAGVRTAISSDAPYGDADPWSSLRAAAQRRTPSGRILGPAERVAPQTGLEGLLSPLDDPGGAPRRIAVGEPADLVLLDRGLTAALRDLDPACVRLTLVAGRIVHRRVEGTP